MQQLWAVSLILVFQLLHVAVTPARITRTEVVKDTSTLYNDDGEILQVSYAGNAIRKSSSIVGLTTGSLGFLITRVQLKSRLMIHNPRITYNTLTATQGRLMMAFTGLQGDVKCILRHAKVLCEDHQVKCAEAMPLLMMTKELCKYATSSLQPIEEDEEEKIGRPLACKGLLIGLSKKKLRVDESSESQYDDYRNVDMDSIRSSGARMMSMMVCEHTGAYYEAPIAVIGKMEENKVDHLTRRQACLALSPRRRWATPHAL